MKTIEEQIKEIEDKIATTESVVVKKQYESQIQKLRLQGKASGGSETAQMLLNLQTVLEQLKRQPTGGGGMDKTEVENMIKQFLVTSKIGINDLSDELKTYLMKSIKIGMELTIPSGKTTGGMVSSADYERPLFQKILSDLVSMNNVYLYGAAGTGKTYLANQIADFMNWEYIELSCNQFTSQLDILGGQTIEGYQRGKLEMAWGNIDVEGNPTAKKGAVLCLDELPKLDPNTAGILNAALAKVKQYKGGNPPKILNGRNQEIEKGNLLIIGTGNVQLNETSTDYEANFKQDLSLQDRFVGSTYEVIADYGYERAELMNEFLFIWIALIKLREKINEMRWGGQAFVSMRIMGNLKSTYKTYREIEDKKIDVLQYPYIGKIEKPKTLQNGLDSFLNLFKPDQVEQLKQAMDYNNFINLIKQKDKMPLGALNTNSEEAEANQMVRVYNEKMKNRIA